MSRMFLLLASLATLLAGCAGDADPESHGSVALSYNGNEAGTHDDSEECDDDATLVGSGTIDEGSIDVTVTDGNGGEVYSQSFDGDVDGDAEHMDGTSGEWTITVVRVPDALVGGQFDGSYSFTLTC